MDAGLAVGGHHLEIPHRRKEVEVAVILVAVSGVVEGIERPVAPEILPVHIDDDGAQGLVEVGR